jgi:D-beta-D-heptose 7-phosphate kinase/D-beta-D-heptose 1-phosphate adenosyltransferase
MPKIYDLSSVVSTIQKLKKQGKKIVLTTGVFDHLHQAHQEFLTKGKQVGDILVVGIETDDRVKKLKGPNRPVHKLQTRLENLAKQSSTDMVFALPKDFDKPAHHQDLISAIRPDIFAVSSHSPNIDKKRALVEKYGGQLVVVMQHDPQISTTKIIQNIQG